MDNSTFSIDKIHIDDMRNMILSKYKFVTNYSKDIPIRLIRNAHTLINRSDVYKIFLDIANDAKIADNIEKCIFEFALIHITQHRLDDIMLPNVYYDKAYDLSVNINKDSYLMNNKLIDNLNNNLIKPQLLAFLSPSQLFPEQWADVLDKKKNEEDAKNNMATTDIYKCRKCGERKSRVTEMQIRSADEPATLFITCMVCHNTFCK